MRQGGSSKRALYSFIELLRRSLCASPPSLQRANKNLPRLIMVKSIHVFASYTLSAWVLAFGPTSLGCALGTAASMFLAALGTAAQAAIACGAATHGRKRRQQAGSPATKPM